MAKDYVVIKGQANIIRNETAEGGNTAAEVGGAIYDVADKLEEVDGTLTSAIGTKLPTSSVVDNLTSTSTAAPLSANQGKVLDDSKADKTTQVVAGNGLTGGGALSGNVTINVGNTDDSIVVGADGIKVDTQNSLTSTSTTKPLSAAQGKALQDNKAEKTRAITAGNGLTGGGSLTEDRTINVVNTDDSIVVSADGIKVDTQDTLTSDSVSKPLSAKQGKSLQNNKAEKTRNIVAGAGLIGGGDLSADRTINISNADDSLVVAADSVKVNTNNTLTSTSTTQPLSANQGKVLNEKVAQVETDLNGKINTTDVEQVRSQATNKVASSKLLDDELKKIEKKSEQIEDYFELSITTPEITRENFAVKTSGQLDNNAQYSHCSPIQVFEGDKVYAKARIDAVSLSAIALTNSGQTFYQSVVAGSNTGEVTVRECEMLADGYITCSYRTDLGLTVEIISSQRINEINDKIKENTADIITLENDVLSLTEEINSYILDRSKSYLKITTRNGKTIDLSGVWNAVNPINYIDWGDGIIVTPSQASHLTHTYVLNGSYVITIGNLTTIPNGSSSSKSFYDMDNLDELYIGSTIQSIGNSGILVNANLKKIQFLGPDVPTTGVNSLQLLQLYPVDKCIVSDESFYKWVSQSKFTAANIVRQITNESNTLVGNKLVVTVGSGGNFSTITDALRYLSTLKPIFKQSGVACQIKILSGTTISEQILISGIDLSYITIVYEDYTPTTVSDLVLSQLANGTIIPGTTSGWAVVPVNSTGWGNISHDSRGYAPFFSAENGGKLPQIGCIFKLTTAGATKSVAYFCNRGSSGIVRTFCGFIGFPAGVISNNESSVTIREGLTMNCADWGVHARHNGEISARSLVASNCGTNTGIDVMACAAYADRIADIDVREAWLDGSRVAMRAHNISRLNANGANITGGGASGSYLVQSGNGSIINCSEMVISNPTGNIFQVATGGSINVFSPVITGATGTILSQTKNIVSENGIIYSNV